METFKKFKIERGLLKFYIILSGLVLTAYCVVLCFGVRHCIAEIGLVTFAYILLAGGAWMFRLCALSWSFIAYTYIIRICMIVQPYDVFGDYLDMAHYIAAGTGGVLCIWCATKYRNLKNMINDGNS